MAQALAIKTHKLAVSALCADMYGYSDVQLKAEPDSSRAMPSSKVHT